MNHVSTGESLSIAVIEAVASEMGVDPLDLPDPLHVVVDPESLDRLFSGDSRTNGTIVFSYCEYEITVTANGDISVEE